MNKDNQTEYKNKLKYKLRTGTYVLKQNKCPCGFSNDIQISDTDRLGLPLRVVLCRKCGIMRSDPYLSIKSLSKFYRYEYRGLYEDSLLPKHEFFSKQYESGKFIYDFLVKNHFHQGIYGKTVFEVGSSAGGVLSYFRDKSNDVVGCDYDLNYIKYGIQKGLDLRLGNSEVLRSYKKKADIVILSHVAEHFPNPVKELKNISKLLKKDGIVFIAVPGIFYIHKSSGADLCEYIQIPHAYYFTLLTLSKIVYLSGFTPLYGDESIFMILKKGNNRAPPANEHYKKIIGYFNSLSKHKFYYLIRLKMENYIIRLLQRFGMLNISVDLYHRIRK